MRQAQPVAIQPYGLGGYCTAPFALRRILNFNTVTKGSNSLFCTACNRFHWYARLCKISACRHYEAITIFRHAGHTLPSAMHAEPDLRLAPLGIPTGCQIEVHWMVVWHLSSHSPRQIYSSTVIRKGFDRRVPTHNGVYIWNCFRHRGGQRCWPSY